MEKEKVNAQSYINPNTMISISKFEKATKLYEKVKALDNEILELEKKAIKISNLDELVGIEVTTRKETEEQTYQEQEASMYNSPLSIMMGYGLKRKPVDNTEVMRRDVTPPTALRIMGMVLEDLMVRRQKILEQIYELGIGVDTNLNVL